jgi:hypothetical protein
VEKYLKLQEGLSKRMGEVKENDEREEGSKINLGPSVFGRWTLEEISRVRRNELTENEDSHQERHSLLNTTLEEKQQEADQYPDLYRSTIWIGKANSYVIPLPNEDEDGMKGQDRMWIRHGEILTRRGQYTLRALVRKERRDYWEMKVLGLGLLLSTALGVWNAIGLYLKKG